MDKIYAYYSKNNGHIIAETLYEHIENALSLIKDVENSKIGIYLHKNFPYAKNFYQLSKMLIVFHDLGKVFYQKEPDKIYKQLSFKGHEFFSTYMFKEFCCFNKKLWSSNETFGLNVMNPIKFAILFHHHAMDIRRREEMLKELSVKSLIQNIELFKPLTTEIENFLEHEDKTSFEKTLESIREKILESETSFLANFRREIESEIATVWREVWNNKNNRIFSLLLLNILMVADNIGASIKRGASQSIFHQSIKDFYNNYLTRI